MDIVGPLPITYQNNQYTQTIQNELTKYSLAICIPDQTTTTIAKALVENIILKFGTPFSILTDQ